MTDWPHSPTHRLDVAGTYMVTAATHLKRPIFRSRERLDLLLSDFRRLVTEHGIEIQAWAIENPTSADFGTFTRIRCDTESQELLRITRGVLPLGSNARHQRLSERRSAAFRATS